MHRPRTSTPLPSKLAVRAFSLALLLFSALVVGIAEMGDITALKRVGLKTLAFTVLVSGIAVILALAVTNFFQPGVGAS